jgi:ABC-2 type transport system ATP-binding protein
MRMIVGLDHPTAGWAHVHGKPYAELRHPLREVGALLDARAVHPGRSAHRHLLAMARSNGIPGARVEEVLELTGITGVADKRAGTFSLGMSQRLGIAGALLGDPEVLIFDEPVNGLDPEGVRWFRRLARSLAAEGRTVLVSSHLMSEMELTADQLVVLGMGRLIADAPMAEVVSAGGTARPAARLRSPDVQGLRALADLLEGRSLAVRRTGDLLEVTGLGASALGDLAHELGLRVHELHQEAVSLEDAYMQLTGDSIEFGAAPLGAAVTRRGRR